MSSTAIKALYGAAVLAISAGIGATVSNRAAAADLADRWRQPPAELDSSFDDLPRGDVDRWSGLYGGASFGYGAGDVGVEGTTGKFNFRQEGGNWSIFVGRNWEQGNSTLFGFEADIGSGGMSGRALSGANNISVALNAQGSLRGRYGFVTGPALMLYGTAGFTWANMDFEVNGGEDQAETLFGVQVGGGAELMFAPDWTLRLEYLYTDLAPKDVTQSGVTNRYDPDFHTFRAGLAWKF